MMLAWLPWEAAKNLASTACEARNRLALASWAFGFVGGMLGLLRGPGRRGVVADEVEGPTKIDEVRTQKDKSENTKTK